MDSIGETMGNAGLAQEIQEGLAKGVMKEPAWASPGVVGDRKKGGRGAMRKAAYRTEGGKRLSEGHAR